jgi:mono/diheme cytochrome c family protein
MTKHHLACLVLGACGAGVPDQPTYFTDVAAILRANCVRCHGADPVDPKIATFRLDRYVRGDEATTHFDVWDYASGDAPPILRVAVDHEAPVMPPDYALTDRQRELLDRWIANGAPKGTRDNHAPELALVSPLDATTADQQLDVKLRTWDADLDGLAVQLWYRDLTDPGAGERPIGALVGGGDRTFALDTGTLASTHTFALYAVLDDGYDDDPANNRTEVPVIPELRIDHGAHGTAPVVQLVSPNGGETLIDTATITWTASDPDAGDSLTYALELMNVDGDGNATDVAVSIATGLTNLSSLSYAWTIPPTITDGTPFELRVTATDTTGNVRSDDSDHPVYVAKPATTTYGWADVRPVFETYCSACHAGDSKTPAIDYFCMLKYDAGDPDPACEASDDGVFETKGLVYQRLVSAKSMPPASEMKPTQAEIDMVGSWILGGAPR